MSPTQMIIINEYKRKVLERFYFAVKGGEVFLHF